MIRKWYKHYILRESIKEIELNKILDKISNGEELTIREDDFLNLYNQTQDNDLKDYCYLSRTIAIDKISDYLDKNKKIWCDLHDRNGSLNCLIMNVYKPDFKLIFKNGEHIMKDNFLYNLKYNFKRDDYSLTHQDEYFEEIEAK